MHTEMWEHPSVQENLATLERRGVEIVPPRAAAWPGVTRARAAWPTRDVIVARVLRTARSAWAAAATWHGLRVVVSAGGTREPLDPVRFITNRSSGKQGHALAEAAAARGARRSRWSRRRRSACRRTCRAVVTRIDVETAADMERAVGAAAEGADVVIMAAAVADFRPKAVGRARSCRRRTACPNWCSSRRPTSWPGWRPAVARARCWSASPPRPTTRSSGAGRKLARKGVDLLVVNDVSAPGAGFDHDTNAVEHPRTPTGARSEVPLTSKDAVANAVLDRVIAHHDEKRSTT